MDAENPAAGQGRDAAPLDEVDVPPIPDDPRVPRPEDAEPSRSKELGGAAPAVGPGPGE